MELIARIKKFQNTNTIDKEGDVNSVVQIVLETRFSERVISGLAGLNYCDQVAVVLTEKQPRLPFDQPKVEEPTLFNQQKQTEPEPPLVDLINAEIEVLKAEHVEIAEPTGDRRDAIENRLWALGVDTYEADDGSTVFCLRDDDELVEEFHEDLEGSIDERKDGDARIECAERVRVLTTLLEARGWTYGRAVDQADDDDQLYWNRPAAVPASAVDQDDQTAIVRHAELMARLQADEGTMSQSAKDELEDLVRTLYERGYTLHTGDHGEFIWERRDAAQTGAETTVTEEPVTADE